MKLGVLAARYAALIMVTSPAFAQEIAPVDATAPSDSHGMIRATLSSEAQAAVTGMNAFSIDLYKRELKQNDNLFLSPASVSTAMALAYRGATGETAEELRGVLHYGAAPDAYLRASAEVFDTMNFVGESRMLQTANAFWVQEGMPLKPDYQSDIQSYMKAGLHRTDFKADPERSRADINMWVSSVTHDRIAELLHKDIVRNSTRAVLVNAIYWKGRWARPFNAAATRTEPFSRLDGTKQAVRLMHQQDRFSVIERGGVQAIKLPYVGSEVSMVVFLPRSPKGLPAFEAGLTDRELARWFVALDATEPRDTVVTLPKMHLAWQQDLKDSLAEMGAPTAFGDGADFSGLVAFPYPGSANGETGLKIANVIHQARLDVDEEGAEAAAATAVVMDVIITGRRFPPPPPPIIFRADRSFFFVLRDNRTGLVLFMGRYIAPTPLS